MGALIDTALSRFTMYRITIYSLAAMILWAAILSFFAKLPYQPVDILAGALLATAVCVGVNVAISKFLHAAADIESSIITALILVLIIPVGFVDNATLLAVAGAAAVASKYVLTADKQHVFNPAAVAVAGISLMAPDYAATWWIGTPLMLPVIIPAGLLILRKTRREGLVFAFVAVYLVVLATAGIAQGSPVSAVIGTVRFSLVQTAVLFFAFVMLTEPATLPPTRRLQKVYGVLVALLYVMPQVRPLSIVLSPEIALCLGNVFSYIVRPKYRLELMLRRKLRLAPSIWSFEFANSRDLAFSPGQYMEWTLPHNHADSRGDRRYFSIASSPTERNLSIVLKVPESPSSYKRALLELNGKQPIVAARLSGDFVLPRDLKRPIAFIAGGVGIAPFRSMLQHLINTGTRRDIILLYSNSRPEDILFTDTLDRARQIGLRTVYILTDPGAAPKDWQGETGHITRKMLYEEVPDFGDRTFFVSGPQHMVQSVESILHSMKIRKGQIHTDYFPGYAEE